MPDNRLHRALDELLQPQAESDRYQEGYDAGYEACINDVITYISTARCKTASKAPQTPLSPQSTPTVHQTPSNVQRLSAPTKDQIVRQYLRAHPGARYRDMNRELPPYVATRVYALEKRGEVRKDPAGGFHLVEPN